MVLFCFVLFLESGTISLSMVIFYSICLPGNDIILVCVYERGGWEKERYVFVFIYGGKGWQWVASFLGFHLVFSLFVNFWKNKIFYYSGARSFSYTSWPQAMGILWSLPPHHLDYSHSSLLGWVSKGVHACMANILSSQPPQSSLVVLYSRIKCLHSVCKCDHVLLKLISC